MKSKSGFTLVELLIAIVVIAILAAISVVAYNGIQQRAKNSAITAAASSALKTMVAYISLNGAYPNFDSQGDVCVTLSSGCNGNILNNATFNASIETVGTMPKSIPPAASDHYGIYFTFHPGQQTWQGASQPLRMSYYLSGNNQDCRLDRIATYTWPNFTPSSTRYTTNVGGDTLCWISVPGPA